MRRTVRPQRRGCTLRKIVVPSTAARYCTPRHCSVAKAPTLLSIPRARLPSALRRAGSFLEGTVAITHPNTANSLSVTKWGDVPIARRAAMPGDSVQLVTSSLTAERDGTRSQIILIATRIGTDNKAPGTPHTDAAVSNAPRRLYRTVE